MTTCYRCGDNESHACPVATGGADVGHLWGVGGGLTCTSVKFFVYRAALKYERLEILNSMI